MEESASIDQGCFSAVLSGFLAADSWYASFRRF